MTLNNLARLLRQTSQPNEAEQLFQRAITTGNKILGADHPLTQRFKSNYARLLLDTHRVPEAHALAAAALAIHAATRAPNHRWTKDSARVTADALDALGRAAEAVTLRARFGIEREGVRSKN